MISILKIFKKVFTYEEIYKGQIMPSWYYGHAYYNWEMNCKIYYIIPINYFIIIGRTIKIFWDKIRSKPTWIDKQIETIKNKMYKTIDNEVELKFRKLNFDIDFEVHKKLSLLTKLNPYN